MDNSKRNFIKKTGIVLAGMGIGSYAVAADEHNHNHEHNHDHSKMDMDKMNMGKDTKDVTYACPMHPQIVSDKPGQCPICNMNLEVVKK